MTTKQPAQRTRPWGLGLAGVAIGLALAFNAGSLQAAWSSNYAYLRLDALLNRARGLTSFQAKGRAEDWPPLAGADSARFVAAYGLGLTELSLGHDPEAVSALQAALAAYPQFSGTHALLGDAYYAMGETSQAVHEWQAAQALPLLMGRGATSGKTGDWIAAINWDRLATQVDPQSAGAYWQLGLAYGAAGQGPAQIEALRTAVSLSPADFQIRYALGLAYWRQGDPAAAAAQFERVLAIRPNEFYTNLYLASIELSLGNLDAAEAYARKSIQLSPANPRTHFALGSVKARRAQWPAAIDELKNAVDLIEPWNRQSDTLLSKTDQISYWLALAQAYRSGGQSALAIGAYQAVLKLNPKNAAASAALTALPTPGQLK